MIRGVFCFWFGEPMSANRENALNVMSSKIGIPLYLVTEEVLKQYEVEPFHRAFSRLIPVHKSDYLRAYFMRHFGGGYCDIKYINSSWGDAFEMLKSSEKYALGYKEVGEHGVAKCEGSSVHEHLKANWEKLIGCGAFICKNNTPFVNEWLDAVEKKLDENMDRLINSWYPFEWTSLMGDIFHPLVYKYSNFIIQEDSVKPDFGRNYK